MKEELLNDIKYCEDFMSKGAGYLSDAGASLINKVLEECKTYIENSEKIKNVINKLTKRKEKIEEICYAVKDNSIYYFSSDCWDKDKEIIIELLKIEIRYIEDEINQYEEEERNL